VDLLALVEVGDRVLGERGGGEQRRERADVGWAKAHAPCPRRYFFQVLSHAENPRCGHVGTAHCRAPLPTLRKPMPGTRPVIAQQGRRPARASNRMPRSCDKSGRGPPFGGIAMRCVRRFLRSQGLFVAAAATLLLVASSANASFLDDTAEFGAAMSAL